MTTKVQRLEQQPSKPSSSVSETDKNAVEEAAERQTPDKSSSRTSTAQNKHRQQMRAKKQKWIGSQYPIGLAATIRNAPICYSQPADCVLTATFPVKDPLLKKN
jgi:ribosome assembly protein YihI (activator of Der GTPase)